MLTVPEYNINAKQREFAGHTGRVFDVDLGQDGLCVTASEDGTARIWRLADGRLEGEVAQSASKDEVLRVAWAPPIVRDAAGASLLAVAGADGFCNLWRGDDWSAPKALQRLDHGGDQVYGCAWSACGDAYGAWLLTAAGAAVRTWDVNAGKTIKQWSYQEPRGDQAYVFDVQPAPRDADDALRATIACAVSDGTARVRDVRLGYDARVLRAPGDSKVTAVGWLAVWKSDFERPTPSTRRAFRSCVCATAWRFHAIDATLSPWQRRLDGVEAHEGPRISTQVAGGDRRGQLLRRRLLPRLGRTDLEAAGAAERGACLAVLRRREDQ